MRLKKLVFSTTYGYLPDVVGGLQTTIHELCLALKSKGIEPIVNCGFDSAPETTLKSNRSDSSLGYQVIRSENPAAVLAEVASASSADAICVLTGKRTVPMIVSALQVDLPTAVYLHNVETAQIGGMLLPDPSLLYFSNSEFSSKRLKALFGIESTTLIPLVDPENYRLSTTREKVLFINPSQIKGVEIFFKIAENLPGIPFQVAESWHVNLQWRAYCSNRAESLGNIDWMSSTRDMNTLYGSTRVLLMPSIWEETYGRCVTEAQHSAIPVIGSNRGGLPEAIGPGGILLDPDGEVSEWITAVEKVFNDKKTYNKLSKAALRHATRKQANPETLATIFIESLEKHIVNAVS